MPGSKILTQASAAMLVVVANIVAFILFPIVTVGIWVGYLIHLWGRDILDAIRNWKRRWFVN